MDPEKEQPMTPVKQVNLASRKITYTFVVGPETDEGTPQIVLSVYHSKERKGYVASLNRQVVEKQGMFTVTKFSLFYDLQGRPTSYVIDKQPTARYSAKALAAFAEQAAEGIEQSDQFAALYAASVMDEVPV